jgi:hypothetical protein
MKKTFQNAMYFVAAMALSMGFASCNSDDDNEGDSTIVNASELKAVSETYINDIVYPTYADLADYCQELNEACTTLYQHASANTMQQSDIDAACEAFKNARREWERSEAFLYGAATDNEIDPHIDSWPLDRKQLVEALNSSELISGIHSDNADEFVYSKNGDFDSVIGFHGLEFVLFRNGANRTVASLSGNETEEGMTTVKGLDELAFAAAVSGDLRNMTALLEYGWNADATIGSWLKSNCNWVLKNTKHNGLSSANIGYGQFLLNATGSNAYFQTWQETLENVLYGGCSNICQEVYTQKLGQAYRAATGKAGITEDGEKESIDYIESPYSKRSFIDYQDNIYSIKNVLYGTRDINATSPVSNSLMTIMQKYNYSGYSTLSTALNDAIAALEAAKNSGIAFVDNPGHDQVDTCIEKITTLNVELVNASAWFRKLKTK